MVAAPANFHPPMNPFMPPTLYTRIQLKRAFVLMSNRNCGLAGNFTEASRNFMELKVPEDLAAPVAALRQTVAI